MANIQESSLHDPDSEQNKPTVDSPFLQSFDLDGIAQYILQHNPKRVVIMCGAGISTNAGIPDFRTPGTGLYDNLQHFDLPNPEAIFEINYFRESPGAFYELCKDMWPGNYAPTLCHYFIRLLSDKGILLRCYSQNIDSLERQAGLEDELLVAAHGNFDAAHVIDDDFGLEFTYDVDITELKEALENGGSEGWQRLREHHGGLVKPKIVFFGEALPKQFMDLHRADLQSCDLLIVLGTSLRVPPFNSLLNLVPALTPRLLINNHTAGLCEDLPGGFCFDDSDHKLVWDRWHDVFHQSDADCGVRELAQKVGWQSDLALLLESKGSASVARASWANPIDELSSTVDS